jgi:hypothetical protein
MRDRLQALADSHFEGLQFHPAVGQVERDKRRQAALAAFWKAAEYASNDDDVVMAVMTGYKAIGMMLHWTPR